MKDCGLNNKTLKSFCVNIISKKINGENIISQNFITMLSNDLKYEVRIGGLQCWMDNFINGSNCIISGIVIPNRQLHMHSVEVIILNINKLMGILDSLEFEIAGEYVDFYSQTEFILDKNNTMIEQDICLKNKYNKLRIMCGMGGMGFGEYLSLEEFNKFKDPNYMKSQEFYDSCVNINHKEIFNKNEILNVKVFQGRLVTIGNDECKIEGFEIDKFLLNSSDNNFDKSSGFDNENTIDKINLITEIPISSYGFDFVSWNKSVQINGNSIEYCKVIDNKNNSFTHTYKINISGDYHTIGEFSLMIPEYKNHLVNNIDVGLFHSLKNKIINADKTFYSIPLDGVIKFNFNHNQLVTYGAISHIILTIQSNHSEEPISNDVIVLIKVFKWNKNYLRVFVPSGEHLFLPKKIEN